MPWFSACVVVVALIASPLRAEEKVDLAAVGREVRHFNRNIRAAIPRQDDHRRDQRQRGREERRGIVRADLRLRVVALSSSARQEDAPQGCGFLQGPHLRRPKAHGRAGLRARRPLSRCRPRPGQRPLRAEGDPPRVLPLDRPARRRPPLRGRTLGEAEPARIQVRPRRNQPPERPDRDGDGQGLARLPQSLRCQRRRGRQGRSVRAPPRRAQRNAGSAPPRTSTCAPRSNA